MEKEALTEDKILSAAYNVFVEKGFEKATMSDIAKTAGINRTVLNYYFRSKELLFRKVAVKILSQAFPAMMSILNSDLPLDEKLRTFIDRYISVLVQNPFVPLFMINEIHAKGEKIFQEFLGGRRPDPRVFLTQLQTEMDKGNIVKTEPIHILLHLFSLCIFPILAKPIVKMVSGKDDDGYAAIIEARKAEVYRFITAGLKP